MHAFQMLCCTAVLFSLGLEARSMHAQESLDDALNRWTSGCEDIWSYDVVLTTTHTTWDERTHALEFAVRYVSRHRFLHGMWRVDVIEEKSPRGKSITPPDGSRAFAWDGQLMRSFESENNMGAVSEMRRFNRATIGGPVYHELFAAHHAGEPYARNLSMRGTAHLSKDGNDYLIDSAPAPTKNVGYGKSRIQVTLEQSAALMPSRIAIGQDFEGVFAPTFVISNTLKKWPAGVWAPSQSTKKIFSPLAGDVHSTFSVVEIVVNEDTARFNIDIDPAIFRNRFPPGTIVYDDKDRNNYIATSTNEKDYEAYKAHVRKKTQRGS